MSRPDTLRSTADSLWKFIAVGCIGFAVDASLLTAIVEFTGWAPWQARIPSFISAVATTWLLNRRYAFAGRGMQRDTVEAVFYGAIQLGGAVLNFAVFTICLWRAPHLRTMLIVPLAIGAIAGLAFNFALSNGLLYASMRSDQRGVRSHAEN